MDPEAKGANSTTGLVVNETKMFQTQKMMKWLRVALYAIIGFAAQVTAGLLTRLYYQEGGTSKWVGTIIQVVGFPVLLPYYFISLCKVMKPNSSTATSTPVVKTESASIPLLVSVYVYLGLLIAANAYLYSVGFEYLPLSVLSLISASQLAFNAFFSFFLNSQKFTPFIINSLLLLTISSVLLVANGSSERPSGVPDGKYVLGFICTIIATAAGGLSFASQQRVFTKVLKEQTFKVVINLVIYQSLVASIVTSIGFFASGEWKGLKTEMEGFGLGKTSYVMILVWTAVSWQVAILCFVALVFELSALLANVIGALGLPVAPIAAKIVFHDKINLITAISMVLAVWGFLSYVYQQYLDERKLNAEIKNENEVSEA